MVSADALIESASHAGCDVAPWGVIEHALIERGYYVGASIFNATLTQRLAARAVALSSSGDLHPARVGRAASALHAGAVRSDDTRWLADRPDDPAERAALDTVDALRGQLNRSLFLGARRAELHFAHYAPGAFYRTHRDRFRDDDARCLTLIFYLNSEWQTGDGGELVLYADDDSGAVLQQVSPCAGTMVCFLSEQFPHEVLPARRARYSLTGWLRRDDP